MTLDEFIVSKILLDDRADTLGQIVDLAERIADARKQGGVDGVAQVCRWLKEEMALGKEADLIWDRYTKNDTA